MSRWQYRKIDLNAPFQRAEDVELLNSAGEQGWELVAIAINGIAYLKRAAEDPPSMRTARRNAPPSRTSDDA